MIDSAPGGASPEPTGTRRIGRYEAYVVVFAASALTLIIEIVAARILAPHIGVSVYTWTSVIGVILAGISLGNWLGGVLADRAASRALLGLILLAGAAATLLILPLAQLAPDWVSQVPLLLRIVLLTGMLFLAPALVLGMVSPIVVKLTLSDISVTGNVVGRIYAVSTAGAIVGVFLTGFVLIQALGSRETLLALAVFTAMMAIGTGRLWQIPGKLIAGILLLGALGVFTWSQQSFASGCIAESNYYCIKVWDRELEDDDPVRVLALDRLVHSYSRPDDPTYLHYSYQRAFAAVAEIVAEENPVFSSLFVGGGGYELPRFFDAVHPRSSVEVIEIDPQVTATARTYLGLDRAPDVVTINEDARMALPRRRADSVDLVIGDAFNDLSVPYHLTTLEFNREIQRVLAPDGIYAVNIVDAPGPGMFLRSFVHTLQQTFDDVAVMPVTFGLDFQDRMSILVLASDEPIDRAGLNSFFRSARLRSEGRVVSDRDLAEWMALREPVLLSDNHAPVDNFLAPLFLKRA